ncbi:MAG: N-acetyl-gamma-glutamyl-phosphate reductase [Clostridiales bacterium]|nr:N-acetyl-gamma-glutamyl-phosphate reductase [Clostridiales bacterium]
MTNVFIDGREGTTGLRIYERLSLRNDISITVLSDSERKDTAKRKQALNDCDVVFLCLPDDVAREAVSMVENGNVKIIDASTAHRTAPGWTYGFPELSEAHREKIYSSRRIAVPGCHASGFIALVYPLVEAAILSPDALLNCFSLTGYSGGGKKMIAQYESEDRDTEYSAPRQYGLTQQHKHLKEMAYITGIKNAPVFMPVVGDFYSGMQVTVPLHASAVNGASLEEIEAVYKNKYVGPIVKYGDMSNAGFLGANAMSGKDSMMINVYGNNDRIILTATYDNLGKGASGAAVECLNLITGVEDKLGLDI